MKKLFLATLLGSSIALSTSALAADPDLATLEAAAKTEGAVNSVGMPDAWANWKGTWADLAAKYGLKHMDTDMSSAQEVAKFAAEKDNASADIGDVGAELLRQAGAFGSDLLVMGCYGHSRLREFVLGGASRHVFEHSRFATLLSH